MDTTPTPQRTRYYFAFAPIITNPNAKVRKVSGYQILIATKRAGSPTQTAPTKETRPTFEAAEDRVGELNARLAWAMTVVEF